jgi:hypothetical protein
LLQVGYRDREILKRITVKGGAYDVCCALSFLKLRSKAVIPNNGSLEAFDVDRDSDTDFVKFYGRKTTRLQGCLNCRTD